MSSPTPKKPVSVACPQCGREILWTSSNPYRPFCSERCKLIDLGKWANEEYRMEDKEQESPE
jgi:endogenous inhibitor of DNA gyrase (YacG/DUF329 family)